MSDNTVNEGGSAGDDRLRTTADDLTLETTIETEGGVVTTVRELVKTDLVGKLGCRNPFRDSEGCAAYIATDDDGMPVVHERDTSVTHRLNAAGQVELRVARASARIDAAMPEVQADPAAALKDDVVLSLVDLKRDRPPEHLRKRAALKNANAGVSLAAIDRAVKSREAGQDDVQTHHGYAQALLRELTEGAAKPVGFHRELHVVEPTTGLWVTEPEGALVKRVAEMHDGKEHCNRSSDYKAIVAHAISLADDNEFFAAAPIGIACAGTFYRVVDGEIKSAPLKSEHRQRVMLPITPAQKPIPQFEAFLHDTFASSAAGEEEQQVVLVQEIAGAIMLGLMPRHQKAVLFYDPFGRAGKGTMERILRNLVPASFVTAIDPFHWSRDYHVAALAGKRLNVVGELSESEPIPAAAFKSVIGGDLVTGRHPTHRPITFTNEAAHLFMSNVLIQTRDQSEAFYARWLIVEFPNSRLRLGLSIDPVLAERIISSEMPGIAYWALEGARRLIARGVFSPSAAHDRLMVKWRRSTSSLSEFIYECCELHPEGQARRSEFYSRYTQWCSESGRRAFSKARVKDLLEHNIALGVRWAEINGYEVFRGLKLKPADAAEYRGPHFRAPDITDPDDRY